VERAGVQFDMCPTCRGVWLDRGELEKLMESARVEGAVTAPVHTAVPPSPPMGQAHHPRSYPPAGFGHGYGGERGEYGERGEWGERGERGGYYKKKSIFDIFD
jgi:hypothetical protein